MRQIAIFLTALMFTGCASLLNKGRSSIIINSQPTGAKVYMNGNERGTAPYTYNYDPNDGATVTFELRLAGHQNGTLSLRPTRSNGVLFLDAMLLHIPYIADAKNPDLYKMPMAEYQMRLFKTIPADMQRQMVPVTTVDVGIAQNSELGTFNGKTMRTGKETMFRDLNYNDGLSSTVVSGLKDTWMDARYVRQGTSKGDEAIQRAKIYLRPKVKAIRATLTGERSHCYGPMELDMEWHFFSGSRTDSILFTETSTTTYSCMGTPGSQVLGDAILQASRLLAEDLTLANRIAGHYGTGLRASKGDQIKVKAPTPIPFAGRREMLAALVKAVVTIKTEQGHGSGFLVSNNGYLITNEHVVGNESIVKVKFEQGFTLDAQVVKVNKDFDLALLKVQATDLPALTVGSDAGLMLGEEIFAIGTPLDANLGQSVSRGVLSGRRDLDGRTFLQTDVSINPGNSGGPFIDENGTVVGVATMKISGKGLEGLGFGVPISVALEMLNIDMAP